MSRLLLLVLGLGGDCPSKSWGGYCASRLVEWDYPPASKESEPSSRWLTRDAASRSRRTLLSDSRRRAGPPRVEHDKRRTYGAHSSNTGRWGDLA
jgi:hypothetical protein